MKQWFLFALLFSATAAMNAQDFFQNETPETALFQFENWQSTEPDVRQKFIDEWKSTAQKEFNRAGVPASIKMAQAILESNAGQSELAREAKNHFGIKCANEWKGKTYFLTDDEKDASGSAIKSCFRKYKNAEDSWSDHSDFLRDPKKYNRYGFLFHLDPKDYRAWAYGLKSAGYASSSSYAESLISVIEAHRLYELDRGATTGGNGTSAKPPKNGSPQNGGVVEGNVQPGRGIGRVNDVKIVLTKKGETLDEISKRTRVSTSKLLDFNDDKYEPTQPLPENTRVFIQKKRNRWRGHQKEHYIKDNQLMLDVAQQYGIKLSKLLKKNRLQAGEEATTGETIKIRGFFPRLSKPRLRSGDQIADLQKTQPTDRPSSQTGGQRPNSGGMVSPNSTTNRPTGNDEELPFDVSNGKIEDRPGSPVGSNPNSNPDRAQPTGSGRPPIETSGSDRPNPDRAQPSGGNGNGSSATTRPPSTNPQPSTRPSGSDMVRPSSGTPMTQPAPTQPDRVAGATYHTVEKGDTLYNLSKKYGTTPAAIRQLNGMADDNIKIGVAYRIR